MGHGTSKEAHSRLLTKQVFVYDGVMPVSWVKAYFRIFPQKSFKNIYIAVIKLL